MSEQKYNKETYWPEEQIKAQAIQQQEYLEKWQKDNLGWISENGHKAEDWEELKKSGSEHYKTDGVEPIDLYVAGDMAHDYFCTSIIKYAFRSRRMMKIDTQIFIKNMDKIIDCAKKLKAMVAK